MSQPTGFLPHHLLLLSGLGIDEICLETPRVEVDARFLRFLITEFARSLPFDVGFYARTYPDVAAAVAAGAFPDLQEHFATHGFLEGRLPCALAYDQASYIERNADLAQLLRTEGAQALEEHFQSAGRFEGRVAHPFGDAPAARWRRAVSATEQVSATRTLHQALVNAYRHPLVGAPGRGFSGGLVLSDNPVDALLRHRRGEVVMDSFPDRDLPARTLPGEYVYAGPYWHQFGHAMAECIHRILPARAAFDCRRLLFVGTGIQPDVVGYAALPSVMREALAFLEVSPEDVTVLHDHFRVETLRVAQQGSDLTGGPSPAYLKLLDSFTPARLDLLAGPAEPIDRLYVSRSRLKHGNFVLGEAWLENQLAGEGWLIFHPETVSLTAQMQAYRGAQTLMFAEGSACHGVELFGTASLDSCFVLERRASHRSLFNAVLAPRARSVATLSHTVALGSVVKDDVTGTPLEHFGVSLYDLPSLTATLRHHGLASLRGLDKAAYRQAARADLASYLAWHRAEGTALHDPEGLTHRCSLLLDQG